LKHTYCLITINPQNPVKNKNVHRMAAQISGKRNGLVGLGFSAAAVTEIVVNQGYTD
jgi:hypothetical protein